MKLLFARFRNDRKGATAVEYGIIAALIAVSLITGAELMGDNIANIMFGLSDTMNNAQ